VIKKHFLGYEIEVVGLTLRYITGASRRSRVEAGSNTSAVALRVVGDDEKGTQCLWYNRAILFLGDINTGT
jgi:hypothetical protein